LGAVCFHTFSDATRDIPKAEWDAERFGQVCSSAETFAEMKSALLRLCYLSRRCSRADIANIREFGIKLDAVRFWTREQSVALESFEHLTHD
jgi:hypothetical protein